MKFNDLPLLCQQAEYEGVIDMINEAYASNGDPYRVGRKSSEVIEYISEHEYDVVYTKLPDGNLKFDVIRI